MNILVAGAGYVGLPLAVSLKQQGHHVLGWVHSRESAEALFRAGIEPVCGDLAETGLWRGRDLPWDAIFYCPSTSGGGAEAYDRIHRAGLSNALRFLSPEGRIFYASSTSVYGQDDGSDVDESSPARPLAEGSKVLLEAEARVLERGGSVLRLAGIYGPERSVYLRKIREGRAVIPGDGRRWVNQIQRDDAVSALEFLWKHPRAAGTWNVADNEAVSLKGLYQWICRETGLPMPAEGSAEEPRKRGLTHKRVLNAKLRGAGWVPKYPTFREGYGELI